MVKRQWDKESFFAELLGVSHEIACRLLAWCEEQGYQINYGEGEKEGTLAPFVHHHAQNRDCKLFEVFTIHKGRPGYVLLASYLWGKDWPESPFAKDEKRRQLIANLNRLPLNKPLLKDAKFKRPYVTLDMLSNDETLKTFLEVHDWVANQIRACDAAATSP